MLKLKITAIGTPKTYQGQKGPFEKNYLKAEEYNDKFLNFYVNNTTKNWKIGDTIEVEAVEERPYTAKDGSAKTSYDIKLPKFGGGTSPEVLKKLDEALSYLAKLNLMVAELVEEKRKNDKAVIPGTDIPYPTAEDEGINTDAINFDEPPY